MLRAQTAPLLSGIAALAVTVEAGNRLYWAWCARLDGRCAPIVIALRAAAEHRPLELRLLNAPGIWKDIPPGWGGGDRHRLFMHTTITLRRAWLRLAERVKLHFIPSQLPAPQPIECPWPCTTSNRPISKCYSLLSEGLQHVDWRLWEALSGLGPPQYRPQVLPTVSGDIQKYRA